MGVRNDWYLSTIADSTELHTVLNHREVAMKKLCLKFVVAEHSSWSFMMGSDSQQYLLRMYQLYKLMGQYRHGKNGHVLYSGNWNLPGNQSVFGACTISGPTYLSLKDLQETSRNHLWKRMRRQCIFCETCPLCHGNKLPHSANADTHPYATHCDVVWV